MVRRANREDRTRCDALCLDRLDRLDRLDHLEGRENLHYDKQTLVEEAFAPWTNCSEWYRSENRFVREVEANHVCEVENAAGRSLFPLEGILGLGTCTLVGVVIGLGRREIVAQAWSEDGGWEENASQSEPLPLCWDVGEVKSDGKRQVTPYERHAPSV